MSLQAIVGRNSTQQSIFGKLATLQHFCVLIRFCTGYCLLRSVELTDCAAEHTLQIVLDTSVTASGGMHCSSSDSTREKMRNEIFWEERIYVVVH